MASEDGTSIYLRKLLSIKSRYNELSQSFSRYSRSPTETYPNPKYYAAYSYYVPLPTPGLLITKTNNMPDV